MLSLIALSIYSTYTSWRRRLSHVPYLQNKARSSWLSGKTRFFSQLSFWPMQVDLLRTAIAKLARPRHAKTCAGSVINPARDGAAWQRSRCHAGLCPRTVSSWPRRSGPSPPGISRRASIRTSTGRRCILSRLFLLTRASTSSYTALTPHLLPIGLPGLHDAATALREEDLLRVRHTSLDDGEEWQAYAVHPCQTVLLILTNLPGL